MISESTINAESVEEIFLKKKNAAFYVKKLQRASEYRTNMRAIKQCQLQLMICVPLHKVLNVMITKC